MAARKPMKGCKAEELSEIPFPCALSFKIDGIRGLSYDGKFYSTSGKPLRNKQIQECFDFVERQAGVMMQGLDGEIINGNPWDKNVMQAATTAAMNGDAVTDFTYWVFDDFTDTSLPFSIRYANYKLRVDAINAALELCGQRPFLRAVEYRMINSQAEYDAMKEEAARLGYEGLYGKAWDGRYKEGRCTPKQAWVWKDKPWTDEEAVVVDFIEMMENTNEAFEDELGRTKRSTSQEGLVPKGYLGSFVVHNPKYDLNFNVSAGTMTMEERKKVWEERESLKGKLLTYKFFDFGIVDVPRSALFKAWRFPEDTTDY